MIKSISKIGLIGTLLFGLSGCYTKQVVENDSSYSKENKVAADIEKSIADVQVTKEYMEIARDQEYNVNTQRTLEGTINSLATQMMRNNKMVTRKPVLITSFVRLDNFKKTTEFGRIVSESLINEMSNRGFNIIEYRGQLAVSINEKGEYFISRDPYKIKDEIPNTYVVVGTYSRQYGKIILNARVIDNVTGRIISTARVTYLHSMKDDCTLFKDCKPARKIKIIKEK
jgi:TolB-like protein